MRPTVVVTFAILAMLPTRTAATTEINNDGKWYGLLSGESATGTVSKCQKNYLPVPAGCTLAQDTPSVRANVIAKHGWSTQVVVLGNGVGIETLLYGTAGNEYVSGDWLETSGNEYKPSVCDLQVMYECRITTTSSVTSSTTTTTTSATSTNTTTTTTTITKTTTTTTTTTTATATTTTQILGVNQACDPLIDWCDTTQQLVCFSYTCQDATVAAIKPSMSSGAVAGVSVVCTLCIVGLSMLACYRICNYRCVRKLSFDTSANARGQRTVRRNQPENEDPATNRPPARQQQHHQHQHQHQQHQPTVRTNPSFNANDELYENDDATVGGVDYDAAPPAAAVVRPETQSEYVNTRITVQPDAQAYSEIEIASQELYVAATTNQAAGRQGGHAHTLRNNANTNSDI